MLVYKTSLSALTGALDQVNLLFQSNIYFKSCTRAGRDKDREEKFRFTLSVYNSRAPGARRSLEGRRLAAACWHAHGHFFEELLKLSPEAKIISEAAGGPYIITAEGGNWQDIYCGRGLYLSSLCDCPKNGGAA